MLELLKKEVSCFFSSAAGYIVIGVFLVFTGLMMWIIPGEYNVIQSGYADLSGLFVMAPMLYLMLIPAVTMRLVSEERKSGTLELLLTHPLSVAEIACAKYLSGLVLAVISLIPTLVYFFSVYMLADPIGNVDTGGTWGSYVGLVLLAAVYTSMGLFGSAITDNQITAFIVSAILCFMAYYGFDMASELAGSGQTESFIQSLGIRAHYDSMSRGVIDSRDLLYFCGVVFLFVSLTIIMLERKR